MEDQVVYRFTEPYGIEREELHTPCFPIGIEFAEICTGPPWSQGDAIDMARRKELEQWSPTSTNQSSPPSTIVPGVYNDEFLLPEYTCAYANQFASTILSILEPTAEVCQYAFNFTHIQVSSEIAVPLTYIRNKIPANYRKQFLNEKTATHYLHLTSIVDETAVIPIHDLVLVAQCMELRRRVTSASPKHQKFQHSLFVENVPDLNSFGILLKWLYTNDEHKLYELLKESSLELILGFAMNCNFWGIIDGRVIAVVRTLLQDLGYELE
jgi:hypothetical protein